MKIKILITTLSILISNEVFSQNGKTTRESFEGVWVNEEESKDYFLVVEDNYLSIYNYKDKPVSIQFWKYGFISNEHFQKYHLNKKNCLPTNFLKNSSDNIVVYMNARYPEKGCLEISNTLYYGYSIENPNSSEITLEYTRPLYYHKTSLPKTIENFVIEEVTKKGMHMPRTYVYTYWEHCCRIISEEAKVYSAPDSLTNIYFIQGDCMQILEEKGNWLKIEFRGKKLISGWVMKNNVKIIR